MALSSSVKQNFLSRIDTQLISFPIPGFLFIPVFHFPVIPAVHLHLPATRLHCRKRAERSGQEDHNPREPT